MASKWPTSVWTRGRFFVMASLLAALQGSGYRGLLPTILRLVLLADVYILTVAVGIQERRSISYQLVVLGLISSVYLYLNPSRPLPVTPPVASATGLDDWRLVIYLVGAIPIIIGTLLHARTLWRFGDD